MSSGYAPLSSWILNPTAPASTSASRWPSSIARAPACMPMLIGHASSPASDPLHRERRLLEARGDERRDAARERRREQLGVIVWTCESTAPGVAIEPVGHVALRVRADDEVDAVADRRAPGPADAGDPAVLDPDVRLDDADDGVDDERAGEHHVELRRPARAVPLRHPRAEVLRVAPDAARRRRPSGPPPRGSTGRCRRAGSGRRSSRRSGSGTPRRTAGSRAALVGRRRRRSGRVGPSSSRPAPSRSYAPAGRSSRNPRAASRSKSSRGLTRSNG